MIITYTSMRNRCDRRNHLFYQMISYIIKKIIFNQMKSFVKNCMNLKDIFGISETSSWCLKKDES